MTPIKAVVFDIGNVLMHWEPARLYDPLIGPDRREALFRETNIEEMNFQVDLGHPFRETIYAWAERYPDWRDEIRLWHDQWIEMAQPEISHSVKLLRALRGKGIPVFSLTNFGVDSYELAAGHYPVLREFDRDFISGHLRVAKPDPKIYEILEETSKLSSDDLIFTDDRPENIDAARARGWRVHLFEGPQGWADRLVAEDLLTVEEAAP